MTTRWLGMTTFNGTQCVELDHIRQSVRNILTTPIGSRVMRREYGSYVPALLDQPYNAATRQKLLAASVMALYQWEPRIRINKISIDAGEVHGQTSVTLDAVRIDGARRRRPEAMSLQITGLRA